DARHSSLDSECLDPEPVDRDNFGVKACRIGSGILMAAETTIQSRLSVWGSKARKKAD
ncbi:hypothetical protein IWW49_005543, partial [Coemansia sp. RSA 1797]